MASTWTIGRADSGQSGSGLCGRGHFALLETVQALIETSAREKLAVRSALYDLAGLEHEEVNILRGLLNALSRSAK